MQFKVPANLKNAPFNLTLAKEAGWSDVVTAFDAGFAEVYDLSSSSTTSVYVQFEFMDGNPVTFGVYADPASDRKQIDSTLRSFLFDTIRGSLCATLADNPMHHAMFRWQVDEGWSCARVFDPQKAIWDDWRAHRSQLQSERRTWFEKLAKNGFDSIVELNLYVMIDPETTLQEVVPLLVGIDKNSVWMMTNWFSDPLNPYSGNNWNDLPTCDAELLIQCSRSQFGDAVFSVNTLTDTPEVAAMTQIAEAFYWRYRDGLKENTNGAVVDLSSPQRLEVLHEHQSHAQALQAKTPFLLTHYVKQSNILLSDGRQIMPALVTIDGAISGQFNPALAAKVKRATGGLGKAPKKFKGPSDVKLATLLKEEIVTHGVVKSIPLRKRMESLAGLEFYMERVLPEDLAAHVEDLYLIELGVKNFGFHRRQAMKYGDHDPAQHIDDNYRLPSLEILSAYSGLKTIDLRSSSISDFSWLEKVFWLEELQIGATKIQDFSPLSFLKNLKILDVHQTSLKTLEPITSLTNLESLGLGSVDIEDVSSLSGMTKLKKLSIHGTSVTDISCLEPLQNLEELILAELDIADYSVLSKLPKLKLLSVAGTAITDLSVLPEIPNLKVLYIWDCFNVTDLSPLERYPNLEPVNTKGTGVVV